MMSEERLSAERAAIAAKWEYFRKRKSDRKRKLLDHEFAFRVDDVGAGWEYIRFELDGKTVDSFRVSYIGPGVRDFVDSVTGMKEKDFKEVVFYDEPGEHHLLFSRRYGSIYIKLPAMEDGFFLRYDYFADRILEEFRRVYAG